VVSGAAERVVYVFSVYVLRVKGTASVWSLAAPVKG
jgi:hypothetical protein